MRFSKSRPINRNGEFVAASLESIVVAAGRSAEIGDDFKVTIVDSWGARAYPIASFMWFVVPKHIAAGTNRNAVAGFLRWMLGPGQRQAAALGYLLLPKDVVSKEEDAIARIHRLATASRRPPLGRASCRERLQNSARRV